MSNSNQNNNHKRRQFFKSSTDVNNYNKFLLELDSKHKTEPVFVNFKKPKECEIIDPNRYQEVNEDYVTKFKKNMSINLHEI